MSHRGAVGCDPCSGDGAGLVVQLPHEAAEQLGLKYLHVKQGKTGVIDYFFAAYLEATKENGKSFMDWVEQDYDKPKVRADFKEEWWANILVDKILRRE